MVAIAGAWLNAGAQPSRHRRRRAERCKWRRRRCGSALSADVLYRILVGDLALQRGDAALAARAYFEAARESQEPRLARRATEVALFARQRSLALEAAKLWQSLDPTAERASRWWRP